jgi:nucleotide-binding universal stress UspA family protein
MTSVPAARWRWPPRTVLVAVDFGEASARAVALANAVAARFEASLRAVYAERFEPPPYFTLDQMRRLETERHAAQAAAADHLVQFAALAGARRVEPVIADERPVDAILDAGAAADLFVLGTHGRRGPGRWWLGSVAERVVRAAHAPVLVTRAAAVPVRDTFERVLVVGDGSGAGATAYAIARDLAAIGTGAVVDVGAIRDCDPGALRGASLVVTAVTGNRGVVVTDPVGSLLGTCERPVLFVPTGEVIPQESF